MTSLALRTTLLRPHLSTITLPTRPPEAHQSMTPASEDAGVVISPEASLKSQGNALEEALYRALSEPRPSNPLLVSLMRRLVQDGGAPSLDVVRAVAGHFSATKDAQNSTVSSLAVEKVTVVCSASCLVFQGITLVLHFLWVLVAAVDVNTVVGARLNADRALRTRTSMHHLCCTCCWRIL